MTTKVTLWGWAFYDFANTIFSAVVLTFYFPLRLTDLTGKNISLGLATTAAMVLAGLVVPWLGALSDRTGKTKRCLIVTTLLCVLFTAFLSLSPSASFLFPFFLLACFFFHASLVFYFALLPTVAPPERQGRASGLGTGLGYLGVLFSIPIAHVIDMTLGRQWVFLSAAVLFFLFALPLFFWVPERRVSRPAPVSFKLFAAEWAKVFQTVKSLGKTRPLLFFFLGNFLLMEAVNTVIFWMVVYLARVFGPPQTQLVLVYLGMNFGAFVSGLLAGPLTDRFGSHKILLSAAGSFFVTLLGLGLTRNYGVFISLCVTGGAFGLAGIWTAGRKRLLELAPPQSVGEYFGLYNFTTKISVFSSLLFSILADRFGFQAALLSQLLPSGLGWLFLKWASQKMTTRE